jgi:hypothetical protein
MSKPLPMIAASATGWRGLGGAVLDCADAAVTASMPTAANAQRRVFMVLDCRRFP